MINRDQIFRWLMRLAVVLRDNKEYLTELDSAIGDADHGINMDRGFQHVGEKLPSVADKDIGTILKTTGMTLISKVGGASGPLYGTFFLRAAGAVNAADQIGADNVYQLLKAGADGIVHRGRAQLGDKTMIDAWLPALDSMQASLQAGEDLALALRALVDGAEQGMKDTIPLQARKGRASYLGERSIGHQDPGATSTYLMLNALLDEYLA